MARLFILQNTGETRYTLLGRALVFRFLMFAQRSPQVLLLLIAFVLLALLYAYSVPLFEAPDELYHFGMIHHLAEERRLPVQVPGQLTIYQQEGSQPPLYYAIGAALVSAIPREDFLTLRQFNPHGVLGVPGIVGNKNRMLHPQVYPPDLRGTTLAVYVVRLFSIVLGATTVCAVYAAARVLLPDAPLVALLAAALTALNPQFIFLNASVNNDNLVTALNSLAIWQGLLMLRDGFTTRRSVLLAVLVALATVSKLSGLVMVPVVALAGLYVAVRDRHWRGLVTLGALMLGVWLLLASGWYLRNIALYGELFGTQRMLDIYGRRDPLTVSGWFTTMWGEFTGLRRSYWAVFGWFSIETIPLFYRVMDVISLAAFAGLGGYLWRIRRDVAQGIRMAFLLLTLTLGFGSFLGWTTQVQATQGRLLFPYIVCSSTFLAIGLSEMGTLTARLRLRWAGSHAAALSTAVRLAWMAAPVGVLAVFAAAIPVFTIIPEYAPPPVVTGLPADAVPVDARFDTIRLLGFSAPRRRYGPGERVPVTLYWQPYAPTELDYSLALEVFLPDGRVIGKIDSYPGWGSLRTTRWQPGAIYADTYRIPLNPDSEGMGVLRMQVAWWVYPTGQTLRLTTEGGAQIASVTTEAIVLEVGGFAHKADPSAEGFLPTEPVTFGGLFRLLGCQLERDHLRLLWEARAAPQADYTVFAQVLADGRLIAQGDAPPALPTRYLRRGERFVTTHTLIDSLPMPEDGTLVIGWYDANRRLSAPYPDDAYPLTALPAPPRPP